MNRDYSGIMLRTPSDIDTFAKSIGWFTKELSEYIGEGKLATRKAPSEKSSKYAEGTIRKGMDNNNWIVKISARGVKRWVPHNP